jgi:hypothetical protein
VFLDYDCEMNKNTFTLVSFRCALLCKVGWELFNCTGPAMIELFLSGIPVQNSKGIFDL